jgi:phosphatidylethanolamine/phosphatidyl-N-methylethanolamine N-methyltransferase
LGRGRQAGEATLDSAAQDSGLIGARRPSTLSYTPWVDVDRHKTTNADRRMFVRQWLKKPVQIGAVVPSSPALARAISSSLPERGHPTVVELGAGTGAFTGEIQRRLAGRGRHLAVELDAHFAALLRSRFTGAEVIESDAVHLPHLLAERGVDQVDHVVSGLPWAVFSDDVQRRLLEAVATSMTPRGSFTTFTYLHATPMAAARRFRKLLEASFEEVIPGRTVWGNCPPALVLYAFRPRVSRAH